MKIKSLILAFCAFLVFSEVYAYTAAQLSQVSTFIKRLREFSLNIDTYLTFVKTQIVATNNTLLVHYARKDNGTCCRYTCDLVKLFNGMATATYGSFSAENPYPDTIYGICVLEPATCNSVCPAA